MTGLLDKRINNHEESHWLSVSDLMAGLMMVFLFIAIALMRNAYIERDQIKQVAVAYQENQVAIYDALIMEFQRNLTNWDAEINEDSLTFTFKSPDVLFASGKSDLTKKYQAVLKDFFPRYMAILDRFKSSIDEVRIEGHTSSDWGSVDEDEAYFENMRLSQTRTRAVLSYVYHLNSTAPHRYWVKKHIAAVGFSSSRLISLNGTGAEDKQASRRVSFRVITNADIEIKRILEVQ